MKRRSLSRLGGMALAAAMLAPGCQSERRGFRCEMPAAEVWVPSSRVVFATMERSTMYTLAHADGQDVLALEQPIEREGDRAPSRLTWLVSLPEVLPFDRKFDVGGAAVSGWLIEDIVGQPSYVRRLEGAVTVHARDGANLTATLNVFAMATPASAGTAGPQLVALNKRVTFRRLSTTRVEPPELETRSGVRAPSRENR